MKKTAIILVSAILMITAVQSQAVDTQWGDLDVTLDSTWVSKYIWRGFDLQDDKAAWQPSMNLDFFDSGWSFNLWFNVPGSSGTQTTSTVNAEEIDYTITYADTAWKEEVYATNWALSYVYFDYPDMASKDADIQEFNLYMEWPNMCPMGAIVPHYQVFLLWPSQGGGAARELGGWIHDWGMTYDLVMDGFLPNNPEQVFTFSADIVYNDGAGLGDGSVDHDWSHILWGVGTDISLGDYGTFTPAMYYQTSMEDTVNPEDEYWVGLSYSYTF